MMFQVPILWVLARHSHALYEYLFTAANEHTSYWYRTSYPKLIRILYILNRVSIVSLIILTVINARSSWGIEANLTKEKFSFYMPLKPLIF